MVLPINTSSFVFKEEQDEQAQLANSRSQIEENNASYQTIGLDKFSEFNRNRIVSIITKEDFIINCGFQHLSAIYKNLDKEDKIKEEKRKIR